MCNNILSFLGIIYFGQIYVDGLTHINVDQESVFICISCWLEIVAWDSRKILCALGLLLGKLHGQTEPLSITRVTKARLFFNSGSSSGTVGPLVVVQRAMVA